MLKFEGLLSSLVKFLLKETDPGQRGRICADCNKDSRLSNYTRCV